jgi:predicted amidohydrolase YtcJ
MYKQPLLLFLSATLLTTACSQQEQPVADMVVTNANIYTVDDANPKAEAMVIRADTLVFVGASEEAQQYIGEQTRVMDAEGKTIIPGLIESHAHFLGVGANEMELDLLAVKSYEEMVNRVAAKVQTLEPGEWVLGRGWHQSKWDSLPDKMIQGFQTHDKLSAVSPDNPVFLRHASGHAAIANAKAMEIAGISALNKESMAVTEVKGGEVFRDELGNPTGIFNERAMTLVARHVPPQGYAYNKKAAKLAMDACLRNGITTFHDAGVGKETVTLYKNLLDSGEMDVRMYVMLSGRDSSLLQEYYAKGPEIGLGNNQLTFRSIKLYIDGALGSRGAWMLEEYSDMPGAYGHETTPISRVFEVSNKALQAGFQVCSHAIGDRANREVLDQYEKAFNAHPSVADTRFRIEHAQHLTKQDIPRFAELGVIPAVQAIHMASDRPWAINRLGKERIEEGAYVWQKLLQSGAHIANGTDAPVEPINPFASFYASVARRTLGGFPEGGFEPSQKMSRTQALVSYTLDGAYAAFEEDSKGSLEPGKLADFTVLDRDIMQVAEDSILNTRVLFTVLGGKVAYER